MDRLDFSNYTTTPIHEMHAGDRVFFQVLEDETGEVLFESEDRGEVEALIAEWERENLPAAETTTEVSDYYTVRIIEVEGGFGFTIRNGLVPGVHASVAEAQTAAAAYVEEREYEDSQAESEQAAEMAVERYYEERGYWAAREDEDRRY